MCDVPVGNRRAALALAATVLVACAPSGQNATPSLSGVIFFQANDPAVTGGSVLFQLDLKSGRVQPTKLSPAAGFTVAPDGKVVYSDGANLLEAALDGSGARTIVAGNTTDDARYNDAFAAPALSPDGMRVAYQGQAADVYVVERSTGALVASVDKSAGGFVNPSWTQDGHVVVAGAAGNPGLFVFGDMAVTRLDGAFDAPSWPAVGPDGVTVLFEQNDHVWKLSATGDVTQITNSTGEHRPFWAPDGGAMGLSATGGKGFVVVGTSTVVDLGTTYPNIAAVAGRFAGAFPAAWR